MRLSHILVQIGLVLTGLISCVLSAWLIADFVERKTQVEVSKRLALENIEWVTVQTDGLQVFLDGTAPTETERLRAGSVAASVVDASRVINQLLVEDAAQIEPPRFSIEILRAEAGISLIGLVPPDTDREQLVRNIKRATGVKSVADLMETADYPHPPSWNRAVDYAIEILKRLPQTKISVAADRVAVVSMAKSPEDKVLIESELTRNAPGGVRVALDITAPRPVASPFLLRLVSDGDKVNFDACVADDEEAQTLILNAAKAAGVPDDAECPLALGVPSPSWGKAAEMSINALAALGGGTLTMSDADISLVTLPGVSQSLFDDTIGALELNLPEVFSLDSKLTPSASDATVRPEYVITLSPEGLIQIRGQVDSEVTRNSAISLAKARFDSTNVHSTARITENLPPKWSMRVLTATEALTHLSNGMVTVTPDELIVVGDTGEKRGTDEISKLLSSEIGDNRKFKIDVTYKEALDPVANAPTPEACQSWLQQAQKTKKITFEPGSSKVDSSSEQVLDTIAAIFKRCEYPRVEIAGYTDSQGGEEMNLELSKSRAESVMLELRARRVLTSAMTAVGYGEEDPIANNKTAEGREANRRIEFRLYKAEQLNEEASDGSETSGDAETGQNETDTETQTSENDNGQN